MIKTQLYRLRRRNCLILMRCMFTSVQRRRPDARAAGQSTALSALSLSLSLGGATKQCVLAHETAFSRPCVIHWTWA